MTVYGSTERNFIPAHFAIKECNLKYVAYIIPFPQNIVYSMVGFALHELTLFPIALYVFYSNKYIMYAIKQHLHNIIQYMKIKILVSILNPYNAKQKLQQITVYFFFTFIFLRK